MYLQSMFFVIHAYLIYSSVIYLSVIYVSVIYVSVCRLGPIAQQQDMEAEGCQTFYSNIYS